MKVTDRLPESHTEVAAQEPPGFNCDCGRRLPWPARVQDETCPDCGAVWEHDGIDLGGGARIKALGPGCHYCTRTGRKLKPCCERHQDDLVCADVEGCRDFLLAELQKPVSGAATATLAERLELVGSMEAEDVRTMLAFIAASAPEAFDAALADLQDDDGGEDQGDDLEPYCSACGVAAGIFYGHGTAYLHYTGQGTAASPVELFDAGHAPVIAWRAAGAR